VNLQELNKQKTQAHTCFHKTPNKQHFFPVPYLQLAIALLKYLLFNFHCKVYFIAEALNKTLFCENRVGLFTKVEFF